MNDRWPVVFGVFFWVLLLSLTFVLKVKKSPSLADLIPAFAIH